MRWGPQAPPDPFGAVRRAWKEEQQQHPREARHLRESREEVRDLLRQCHEGANRGRQASRATWKSQNHASTDSNDFNSKKEMMATGISWDGGSQVNPRRAWKGQKRQQQEHQAWKRQQLHRR